MESEEIREFIRIHKNTPLPEVALLLGKRKELPKDFILNQINGWQKSKDKLPEWHSQQNILYPDNLSLEQASSERTAKYKACLASGQSMADLTGGLGIDCYYFSKKFKTSHYVEPDKERLKAARHNFAILGANLINCHQSTAEDFLKAVEKLDFIYLDPDRRSKNKKQILIEDCNPDLTGLQDRVFSKTESYMVKFSPMLDISLALEKLKYIEQVHVVSVDNECKEILFIGKKEYQNEAQIHAVNFQSEEMEKMIFMVSEEKNCDAQIGELGKYLYEPNASIRKAGAFKLISKEFQMQKLHINTHLYSSDKHIEDFPGRVFKIVEEINPKTIRSGKLNVISKNFPMKAVAIKKKYKIKDGQDDYLIATTLSDSRKVFLLTKRIK